MSYRVKIEAFEGPFDLLLHLVSRQKVDISAISIADIADQYLAEIDRMRDLDLDVASDFLVVAATLLQMKASSLIPAQAPEPEIDDEFDDLTPEQARDILVERLVVYKQFKSCAAALGARMENEGHMHPRHAALEPRFSGLVPDYLEGMTLHGLAVICADIASRRDTFLLEAEHIAAVPISMEKHVEGIYRTMRRRKDRTFSQLVGKAPTPELVVVTFLAVLELYKRGVVSIAQDDTFGDIALHMEDDAPEVVDFSVPDWGMPEDPSLAGLEEDGEGDGGADGAGAVEGDEAAGGAEDAAETSAENAADAPDGEEAGARGEGERR